MRTRPKALFRLLLAGALLLSSRLSAPAQAVPPLPARGVVTFPVWVRVAPPNASAFSYSLAARICSVGPGSLFQARDMRHIVNGEVWFWVRMERPVGAVGCPSGAVAGWLAGKLRDRWIVSFDTAAFPDTAVSSDTVAGAHPGTSAESPRREPRNEGGFNLGLRYLALVVGTIIGFYFFQVLSTKHGLPWRWPGWPAVVLIEATIAGGASFAIGVLLLEYLTSVPTGPVALSLAPALSGSYLGFGILGAVVAFFALGTERALVRNSLPFHQGDTDMPPPRPREPSAGPGE